LLVAEHDEIYQAEQLIRDRYPASHPDHRFWGEIADWFNSEASRGLAGLAAAPGDARRFNRALAAARAYRDMVAAETLPTAEQIRTWLRAHNWREGGPGQGGTIWSSPFPLVRIGVPHDDADPAMVSGAVERIARRYGMEVRALVIDVKEGTNAG
jgi:hypothetical protein